VAKDAAVTAVLGRFDPLLGYGLAHVLSVDPTVCVLARDLGVAELERTVLNHAPAVAVLDEKTEPSVLKRLRSLQPATGVIILADSPSHAYGMNLLTSGATCLARSASTADILAAIHFTARGGRLFVSPDGERAERRYPDNAHQLTRRETEVLEQVSTGRSNPEIAHTLQISVETVHTHVARIRQKLKVQSKRELIGMPVSCHSQFRLMMQ
jgi:DNA-binding NarL/FixJ family response regulator